MNDRNKVLSTVKALQAQFECLGDDLLAASTHFYLFKSLWDLPSEFEKVLNTAPLFWRFTRHAHLQAAVISLCRIYDQHKDGNGFRRLLNGIKRDLRLFDHDGRSILTTRDFLRLGLSSNARRPSDEQLHRDIAFCSTQTPLIATLITWRDKAIAHKDHGTVVGGTASLDENHLTHEDMQHLITEGFRILNDYSTMFQAREFGPFPPEQLGDYTRVLRDLRPHLFSAVTEVRH